jgi:hypothetical protein
MNNMAELRFITSTYLFDENQMYSLFDSMHICNVRFTSVIHSEESIRFKYIDNTKCIKVANFDAEFKPKSQSISVKKDDLLEIVDNYNKLDSEKIINEIISKKIIERFIKTEHKLTGIDRFCNFIKLFCNKKYKIINVINAGWLHYGVDFDYKNYPKHSVTFSLSDLNPEIAYEDNSEYIFKKTSDNFYPSYVINDINSAIEKINSILFEKSLY